MRAADVFLSRLQLDAPGVTGLLLCAEDLTGLYTENYDGNDPTVDRLIARENIAACYAEWLRRLGGVQNIASYAATLAAGIERKRDRARVKVINTLTDALQDDHGVFLSDVNGADFLELMTQALHDYQTTIKGITK